MIFSRSREEIWDNASDWTALHEMVVTSDKMDLDTGYTFWVDLPEKCSRLDRSSFEQMRDSRGIRYWKINLKVELQVQTGTTTWKVKAPRESPETFLTTMETKRNRNSSLGFSLINRGTAVPEMFTQSLEEQQKKRKRRKFHHLMPT